MKTRLLVVCLFTFLSVIYLHAQDAATLLDKSRQVTTLEQASGPSFHLRAEFHTFDYKGVPDGDGTIDETFEHGGRWKRTIVYRQQQMVQVFTGAGTTLYEASPEFESSFAESGIVGMLLAPIPQADKMKSMVLTTTPLKMGSVSLTCVVGSLPYKSESDSKATAPNEAYCIAPDTGLVRNVQAHNKRSTVLNSIVKLNTVYFAKDISMIERGRPRANLHVTALEPLPKIAPDEFTLAGGSAEHADTPVVPRTVTAGRVISKPNPLYPEDARQRHVQGTVVLHAIISKLGTIRDLELASTPDDSLAESAMDAVRKWKYQPYLLDGKPTDVDTNITVNYAMSR